MLQDWADMIDDGWILGGVMRWARLCLSDAWMEILNVLIYSKIKNWVVQ